MESALLGRRLSGSAVLLGHFTWNGIRSVRTCTKLHWLIGSNILFIGPVNSVPRVDMSKMSKRTDLSLAEKIALLDKIHSQPQVTSHRRLAELLAVPKLTIGRLVRQEQELQQRSSEETQRVHPGKRKQWVRIRRLKKH